MNQRQIEKASAYWTPARQKKFLGGRQLLLTPWQGTELLLTLGLLNQDGSFSADASRKFVQVNHMLQLLLPPLRQLCRDIAPLQIVDAGCGNAYLSFILAWYLRDILHHPASILGLDHSEAQIARARERSEQLGFAPHLHFLQGDLRDFRWDAVTTGSPNATPRPHVFLALHACDVASDFALAEAIRSRADMIAVAPCCQAELARLWKEAPDRPDLPLRPMIRNAHFRRELAADMTDMLRVLLLRSRGYEVNATEFVPSEHTPKNRLLLASRRGNFLRSAWEEYLQLQSAAGGAEITLAKLLPPMQAGEA